MRKVLVVAAVLGGSIVPAAAADLMIIDEPVYEAAMAAAHDWNGAYAGVHGGWLAGNVDAPYSAGVGGPLTAGNDPFAISGWLVGVHAGVNMQHDSFVGGVEVLADYAPFSGNDGGAGGDANGLNGRFLGTVAGRVGMAVESVYFYLSGGGAVLVGDGLVTDPGAEETVGATFFGGTVGAGVEVAFDENISGRLDYRYYHFARSVVSFPGGSYDIGFSPSFHTVSAGVSVGF